MMIINGIYNVIIDFGKFCGFTELLYRQPIARIRIEHESFVSYILNILEVFKNYFKYFFNVMDYGCVCSAIPTPQIKKKIKMAFLMCADSILGLRKLENRLGNSSITKSSMYIVDT